MDFDFDTIKKFIKLDNEINDPLSKKDTAIERKGKQHKITYQFL
jgi:hypothetical protein